MTAMPNESSTFHPSNYTKMHRFQTSHNKYENTLPRDFRERHRGCVGEKTAPITRKNLRFAPNLNFMKYELGC